MRLYIHGNCQAYVLGNMLRDAYPGWDVTAFEVHTADIIDHNEDYRRAVREADIILTQPIHDGYRERDDLSASWVRANARPGSRIITIPAMHFEGHHLGGRHLSAFGELGRDALAAHLVAAGIPTSRVVEMLLSPDLLPPSFVRSEIAVSLAEMRRRESEDGIDLRLSESAVRFAGHQQMFHLVNHPCRPLYVWLLNAVLDVLEARGPRLTFAGPDYQPSPHVPIYPCVTEHAPRAEPPEGWEPPADVVRFPHLQPMPQRDFVERVVAHLAANSCEEIRAALRQCWRSSQFLRRLAGSEADLPGLDAWRIDSVNAWKTSKQDPDGAGDPLSDGIAAEAPAGSNTAAALALGGPCIAQQAVVLRQQRMRPSIIFLGNAQANALQQAWVACITGSSAYDSSWVPYQNPSECHMNLLRSADVVVSQISDIEGFDVGAVNSRAQVIRYPYVNGAFLWPYSGFAHPRWDETQMEASGAFAGECGDAFLAQLYRKGVSAREAIEIYANLDIVKAARLERRYEIGLETQRLRDAKAGLDVGVADYIDRNLGRFPLFISRQTPSKPLFWHIARVVFQRLLNALGDCERKAAQGELLHYIPLWGVLEMPIHPGIVSHFGIPDRDPEYRYRVNRARLTFNEFVSDYMNDIYQVDILEGTRLLESGKYEDAEARLTRGFELAPSSPNAAAALSRALANQGRHLESLQFACAAVHLDTEEQPNQVLLAQRYLAVGWLAAARAALERSQEIHFFDWQSNQMLLDVYVQAGDSSRALKLANRLVQALPDFYLAQFRLGQLQLQNGMHAEAEATLVALQEAVAGSPNDADAHAHLGHLQWAMRRLPEAKESFCAAVALSPERLDLKSSLIEVLAQLDQPDQGLPLAVELAVAQPGNAYAQTLVARLLWRSGQHEEAAERYQQAVELDPTDPEIRLQFSGLLETQGDLHGALDILACEPIALSTNPNTHVRVGYLRMTAGELDQAKQAFLQALHLEPGHPAAKLGLEQLERLKPSTHPIANPLEV